MNFLPCTSFEGKKDGYYFGTKDNQTGYYLDHNAMSKKRSRDVSFATTSTANIPAMSKKRPRDVAFSSSSSSSSATPAANKFNHFINTFLISVHTSFSKYTNNIVAQGITDQQLLCFATKDQLVRYCQVLPFHADLIINKAALIQQLTPASPIIITQPTSTPSKVTPSCEFKAGQTIYAIAGTAWYKGTIEYPDSEEEANVSLSDLLQYREARAQQVFDALSKKMEHYQAKINVFEVKAKAEGALVVHNKKIFETTLKEGGVKLTKGKKKKKRKVTNNYSAYGIGEEEGKNHNIHQKSIKDDGKKK